MTTGIVRDQNHIEKQMGMGMGCMAGFLQIFDRHQILTGKRIYSAKRLPLSAPPAEDSSPEPEKFSVSASPVESTPSPGRVLPQSPPTETQSPTPSKMPLEFKEGTRSSWKFGREGPRLSLDSRAVVDAKGGLHPREIRANTAMLSTNRCENLVGEVAESDGDKQRRSTSVIARLMGLEPLPDSDPEPVKKAELRRSASESRVSKDLLQYRFFDSNNFQLKQLQQQQANSQGNISGNVVRENAAAAAATLDNRLSNGRLADPTEFAVRNGKTEPPKAPFRQKGIGQKKSFYDSADFFPEPKQNVSTYGEIEKRLKMRGIDEPSKDVETLKHILDALQLKGLLHSKKPTAPTNHRNFVFDGSISGNESPIVVMRPARSSGSLNRPERTGADSPPSSFRSSPRARRSLSLANETLPTASRRRDVPEIDRNVRTQARAKNSNSPTTASVKSPNRRKLPSTEAERKVMNDGVDSRRASPVHSPRISSRRNAPDQQVVSRSPRMRKATAPLDHKEEKVLGGVEDESSTISESSFSTSSQTDTERYKLEEYKEGRNLLERCDRLLNSIAEITATTELQPSPVSVLDSSFYKDECFSPSPVTKRCIDYKDQPVESEDDIWSAGLCCSEAKSDEASDDCDFIYVSEILRASSYLPEYSDIFLLLEKQQYLKGKDTSKASTLQRRLIFDTIHEILNRNRQLPPWKAVSYGEQTQQIWSEFLRIRERAEESEELFEVICGVLRKDLAEEGMANGFGWGEWAMEMGDVVLDMERLVFKDLIGETIRELASSAAGQTNKFSALRRKLLF